MIYSCDNQAEFSAADFQFSLSHDPSEIILMWCSRNIFFFFINIKNYSAA